MSEITDKIDAHVEVHGGLPPKEAVHKLFVYGTLKRGYHNHHNCIPGAKYLGEGLINGIMVHCGGFPALSIADKFNWIKGEVYEVTEHQLARVDRLEGHPNWYYRIKVLVQPFGLVWVYIFPQQYLNKEDQMIPGGEWKGENTPTVKWLGIGKGVLVGNFSALPQLDTIRVGKGDRFVLKRNEAKQTYDLVDKATGEFRGSYKHLGDMTGKDGNVKPILRLPAETRPSVSHTVREHIAADGTASISKVPVGYNPPPRRTDALPALPGRYWSAEEIEGRKMQKIKEQAESMGLKVRAA